MLWCTSSGNGAYSGARVRVYTAGTANVTAHNVVTTGDYTDGVKVGGLGPG